MDRTEEFLARCKEEQEVCGKGNSKHRNQHQNLNKDGDKSHSYSNTSTLKQRHRRERFALGDGNLRSDKHDGSPTHSSEDDAEPLRRGEEGAPPTFASEASKIVHARVDDCCCFTWGEDIAGEY